MNKEIKQSLAYIIKEKITLVKCAYCHKIVDRYNCIQENTCDYNPTDDDLECWEFKCETCSGKIETKAGK